MTTAESSYSLLLRFITGLVVSVLVAMAVAVALTVQSLNNCRASTTYWLRWWSLVTWSY